MTSISDYIHGVLPTLHGWCTPEKAQNLAEIVTRENAIVCVEIGVYAGRSLFAMALATRGKVIGIDPWDSHASEQGFPTDDANREWWHKLDHNFIYDHCVTTRQRLGLENKVHLCRSTAQAAYGGFAAAATLLKQPPIDLLHIDGNHSEECSTFDVTHYVPLVRQGGTVVFDDVDWGTTKRAQELLSEWCEMLENHKTYAVFRKK